MRSVLTLILCFCASNAGAAFKKVSVAQAERFDQSGKTWQPMPTRVDWDAKLSQARVTARGLKAGQPLTARLDFKRLPHYGAWIAHRKAAGGATWLALKALLDEVGDGPAVALSQGPVPSSGPLTLLLGLRKGAHFEPFATVTGSLEDGPQGLVFVPAEPRFSKKSAALAWELLKPLAQRHLSP